MDKKTPFLKYTATISVIITILTGIFAAVIVWITVTVMACETIKLSALGFAAIISFFLVAVLLGISSVVTFILLKRTYDPYYMQLAFIDALTGLKNRTAFEAFANTLSSQSCEEEKYIIVMLDLNYLKQINDESGHMQGDRYLQTAAEMMKKTFDTLGSLYRIGGDEFVVVISGRSVAEVREAVEMLRALQKEYNASGNSFDIEIACGFAEYDPAVDSDFHSIFVRADDAMYYDKKRLKTSRAQSLAALQGQVISWVDDRFVERRSEDRRKKEREDSGGRRWDD